MIYSKAPFALSSRWAVGSPLPKTPGQKRPSLAEGFDFFPNGNSESENWPMSFFCLGWYPVIPSNKKMFQHASLASFFNKKTTTATQLNSTQLNSSWTPESDPSASPSVRSYVAVARVPKPISDIPSARRVVALMAWRREILEKWVWAQKREIRILKNKKHHLSLSTFLSFCQVQGIEPSLFKMGNQRKPCHIEPRFPFFHEVNSKLTWDAIFMMQIT